MLTFKRITKCIVFMSIILFINMILIFILEPKESESKIMWQGFYKEKNLNMLFIGSSVCQRSFNPYIIDDILKTNSFNMGTPAQLLQQTYVGINEAVKKHKIKAVIIGMGHFTLTQKENLNAEIAFTKAKAAKRNKIEKIKEIINFIFSNDHIKKTESINYFFPWIFNRVNIDYENISNNIKNKINSDWNKNEEKIIYEIGKGFGIARTSHNYNKVGSEVSGLIYSRDIYLKNFEILKKISKFCKENNVDLIVVNPPHPYYDILSYGDEYFFTMKKLKDFFGSLNISYYDFNLIKPSIFQSKEDYFYDFEHLNEKGSTEFSKSFAKFMKLKANCKDMNEYFYTPEEYLASIKHISIVDFDTKNIKEGVDIITKAYTGSKVNVEYEILVYDDILKKYKVIRKYDQNPSYFYPINENKKIKIRVNARQIGADIPYEKYYEKEIVFRQ